MRNPAWPSLALLDNIDLLQDFSVERLVQIHLVESLYVDHPNGAHLNVDPHMVE